MKYILDTEAKTIKLLEDVKLGTLAKHLQQLFPNGEWKEYTLEHTTVNKIDWVNPIVIGESDVYPISPSPLTAPYTPLPFWWENKPTYGTHSLKSQMVCEETRVPTMQCVEILN